MEIKKGRIVDIEKCQDRVTYIKQGVQGPEQYKYDNCPGGNGTYVTGGSYLGTSLNVKIYVYDLAKSFTFDVYEDVKKIANVSRISSQLMQKIESHKGDKVNVSYDEQNVYFDPRILLD